VITNIKRNIVFIALALLAWFGYGDLDQEKSKAAASTKSALRPIELADITAREPPADWVLTRDPYGLVVAVEKVEPAASSSPRTAGKPSRAPPGQATSVSVSSGGQGGGAAGASATPAGAGSEAGAGAVAHTGLHPAVPSLARWGEHAEALLASLTATSPAPPPELAITPAPPAELPPVQFTLQLQSTLAQTGGGQARISGQTVEVGAALLGFDPYSPPVLRSLEGSVAVVTHRGKDYVLDLDHQAVISVGTPGVEVAAAPTRESSGMGGGSANSRSRSTAAPKPAAAKAATPATAPAPGAPKKATYKARSYPGKPKS